MRQKNLGRLWQKPSKPPSKLRGPRLTKGDGDAVVKRMAILFPSEATLYAENNAVLVEASKERGISVRQSYVRVGEQAVVAACHFPPAQQIRLARRPPRAWHACLGRVERDRQSSSSGLTRGSPSCLLDANPLLLWPPHDMCRLFSKHVPQMVHTLSRVASKARWQRPLKTAASSGSRSGQRVLRCARSARGAHPGLVSRPARSRQCLCQSAEFLLGTCTLQP